MEEFVKIKNVSYTAYICQNHSERLAYFTKVVRGLQHSLLKLKFSDRYRDGNEVANYMGVAQD